MRRRLSMRGRLLQCAGVVVAGVVVGLAAMVPAGWAANRAGLRGHRAGLRGHWVASWGASPVVGVQDPYSPGCPAAGGLNNQTVRNVVFVSTGGNRVRVRLTNTFGDQLIDVGHATVARQASDAAPVPGTIRTLTFGGKTSVTLAAGGEALSDPIGLRVPSLSNLLLSVYVPGATGPVTDHPSAAQTNYLAPGDQTAAGSSSGFSTIPCWMLVDAVDVSATPAYGAVVALGDSITDTAATTANANHRWPNDLARRLLARRGPTLSVIDEGIGGDNLLTPRVGQAFFGVPALARLDRDVFSQAGARDVIMLIGVNDIGTGETAAHLISGYQQVAAQAHARGLRIFGGTVMPFKGFAAWTPEREAIRQTVNQFILTSRAFDGSVDFATATADPNDPQRLNPAYDSGDHLHPNDAGTQAMANAVNLAMLLR